MTNLAYQPCRGRRDHAAEAPKQSGPDVLDFGSDFGVCLFKKRGAPRTLSRRLCSRVWTTVMHNLLLRTTLLSPSHAGQPAHQEDQLGAARQWVDVSLVKDKNHVLCVLTSKGGRLFGQWGGRHFGLSFPPPSMVHLCLSFHPRLFEHVCQPRVHLGQLVSEIIYV